MAEKRAKKGKAKKATKKIAAPKKPSKKSKAVEIKKVEVKNSNVKETRPESKKTSWKNIFWVLIAFLILGFLTVRARNTDLPLQIKQDIQESQTVVKENAALGHFQLAVNYLRAGKIFEVQSEIKTIHAISSENQVSINTLVQSGIAHYRKMIQASPSKQLYYYVGFLYFINGDYQQSLNNIDVILRQDPSEDFAFAFKAYLLAVHFNQVENAITELQKALALKPKSSLYSYLSYEAYKLQKDTNASNNALRQALWQFVWGY